MKRIKLRIVICIFFGFIAGGSFEEIDKKTNSEYVSDDYDYEYPDDLSKAVDGSERELPIPSNFEEDATRIAQPYFENPEIEISSNLNDNVTIDCDVQNFNAGKTIMWYKDNTIIMNGHYSLLQRIERIKNNSISIKNVNMQDAGDYYCMVLPDNIRLHTSLKVVDNRKSIAILVDERDVTDRVIILRQGKSYIITCKTGKMNNIEIKWSFNGHRVTENVHHGDMLIDSINDEYEGIYQCLGDDGSEKPLYAMVTVNVHYTPKVFTHRHHINTEPKADAELYCDYKANPIAVTHWLKDNVELSNSEKYRIINRMHKNNNRTELIVKYSNTADLGEYICRIENTIGMDEAKVYLVYEPEKPQFENIEINGQRVVLQWLVRSKQSLSEAVLDYKISGSYTWSTVSLMQTKRHGNIDSGVWKITHKIDLIPGNWHARVKTKNTAGWSSFSEQTNFTIAETGEPNNAAEHKQILTNTIGAVMIYFTLLYTYVPYFANY